MRILRGLLVETGWVFGEDEWAVTLSRFSSLRSGGLGKGRILGRKLTGGWEQASLNEQLPGSQVHEVGGLRCVPSEDRGRTGHSHPVWGGSEHVTPIPAFWTV